MSFRINVDLISNIKKALVHASCMRLKMLMEESPSYGKLVLGVVLHGGGKFRARRYKSRPRFHFNQPVECRESQ